MPVAKRKVALTDRSLKALKPPDGVVWDALLPGLAVRVSGKGKRSFYAIKRRSGDTQPSWIRLGEYPVMSLGEARATAREALAALMAGQHPSTLADAKRRRAEMAMANTFAAVAERYAADKLPELKPTTRAMYAMYLRTKLIPALGQQGIDAIKRRDVIALVEGVKARSGKAAAGGALAVLRRVLEYAVARELAETNPAASVDREEIVGKSKARDRLLSDADLAAIWRAVDAVGEPFASLYKTLLLTGARREEIAAARWEDLDEANAQLAVPAERAKSGQAMLIPLAPQALAIIAASPRFTGPYIFTTTAGRSPVTAFSGAKARLDAALGGAVAPFVIHDFRRAVRSGLGRLGVDTVVAELVLGHTQPGIVGVYDRHSYFDEKRAALERWERHLLGIVDPAPDNVIALPARARG